MSKFIKVQSATGEILVSVDNIIYVESVKAGKSCNIYFNVQSSNHYPNHIEIYESYNEVVYKLTEIK